MFIASFLELVEDFWGLEPEVKEELGAFPS